MERFLQTVDNHASCSKLREKNAQHIWRKFQFGSLQVLQSKRFNNFEKKKER